MVLKRKFLVTAAIVFLIISILLVSSFASAENASDNSDNIFSKIWKSITGLFISEEKSFGEDAASAGEAPAVAEGNQKGGDTIGAMAVCPAGMSGDGSSATPCQVTSWTQLNAIRTALTLNYTLTTSLSSSTAGYAGIGNNWQPIGPTFSGNFNGNGKTISNLVASLSINNVGLFGSTSGNITNLGVNVAFSGAQNVGGLVGSNGGTISNCYSTGSVSGSYFTGGLVGSSGGAIKNSYSAASVNGDSWMGGLVGSNGGTISNCYSIGSVDGVSYRGGFLGYAVGGAIINSYWNTQTSGRTWSAGGEGKTTAQMKIISTFSTWNISASSVNFNDGYPYLGWQINDPSSYSWLIWSTTGPVCGNNITELGEQCDPPGNGCSATCQIGSVCGNHILEAGEQCDDGNTINGDGCSSTCQFQSICGNNIIEFEETCDDGNNVSGDGCNATCQIEALAGSGTQADPYRIYTCQHLQSIKNNNLSAYYSLANNINCGGFFGFYLIGSYTSSFTGFLEGNNYVIYDLNTSTGGIFASTSGATIRNLGLVNVNIIDCVDTTDGAGQWRSCGALVHLMNGGLIENCFVTGNITDNLPGNPHGETEVGGLVGTVKSGTVRNCYSMTNIRFPSTSIGYKGGLIGYALSSSIQNCFAAPVSRVSGSTQGPGLIGATPYSTISNSYCLDIGLGCGSGVTPIYNASYFKSYSNAPINSWVFPPWSSFCNGYGYPSLAEEGLTNTNQCRLTPDGVCGNSIIELPEQCDDANTNNNDSCKNNCTNNICGDGVIYTGVEGCDDGNTNNGDGCSSTCQTEAICGNNVVESGETCDDGNTVSGDGCSIVCAIEAVPGSGTQADPYRLYSCEQLQNYLGGSYLYVLARDIDCSKTNPASPTFSQYNRWSDGRGFDSIATCGASPSFSGTLDGQNHTINNLYLDYSAGLHHSCPMGYTPYLGLIGTNGGTIKNLGLTNVTAIAGGSFFGTLVGVNGGLIKNCYVTGTINGATTMGALAGDNKGGTITNSYSKANVNGSGTAGSLVGRNNGGTIADSYATGNVSVNGNAGGLAGLIQGYGPGGAQMAYLNNSYATGSVSGTGSVGGLIGRNGGGLVTITNSYWDTQTSGKSTSAGGEGKTTAQMKQQSTYIGWDFTNVWGFTGGVVGSSYPRLLWEPGVLPPPSPVCGNGINETGEQCDDGNTNNGDGCSSTCQNECTDADGDGYNVSATGCGPADCNDNNNTIHPGATELCDGTVDDDCDTQIDEGCGCTVGQTQQCGLTDVGECEFGLQTCDIHGIWGDCIGAVYPVAEICGNGIDDDCDGNLDNGCGGICDTDGDNHMQDNLPWCILFGPLDDCDDNNPTIYTGAPEICDGIDNQCPGDAGYGTIDEGCIVDIDNDGIDDAVDNCASGTTCNMTKNNCYNPDQRNTDGNVTDGGDLCDKCANFPVNTCPATGSGSAWIDSSTGGVVSNSIAGNGNASFNVPAGALDESTTMSMQRNSVLTLGNVKTALGSASALAAYWFNPANTTFNSPVTITTKIGCTTSSGTCGTMGIFVKNSSTGIWDKLPDSSCWLIGTNLYQCTATTMHFSEFAVLVLDSSPCQGQVTSDIASTWCTSFDLGDPDFCNSALECLWSDEQFACLPKCSSYGTMGECNLAPECVWNEVDGCLPQPCNSLTEQGSCDAYYGGMACVWNPIACIGQRYVNPDGICGGNTPCYKNITAASNAAAAGNTICVAAGNYTVNSNTLNWIISASKTGLTFLGAEAGIDAKTRDPNNLVEVSNVNVVTNQALRISAANVTIDGFRFNPGFQTRMIDSASSSTMSAGLILKNNIFLHRGTTGTSANGQIIQYTAGNLTNSIIKNNLFIALGTPGSASIYLLPSGTLLLDNLVIEDNKFVNTYAPILIARFDGKNYSNVTIRNNILQNTYNGIIASDLVNSEVSGNTISGGTNTLSTAIGIRLSNDANVNVSGNIISNMPIGITTVNSMNNVVINNNVFTGTFSTAALKNYNASVTVNAEYNYWANETGPNVTDYECGAGAKIIGLATFCPFYKDVGLTELDTICSCGSTCTDADSDGYSIEGGDCGEVDCNDNDINVNPGTAEVCNGIDDDCDGVIDNGIASTPTTCGVGACASTGELVCQNGTLVDSCVVGTPSAERCDKNYIDEDCDGSANENCGGCFEGENQNCGSDVGECEHGIQTCDITGNWGNCDGQVLPSDERCDGLDNDCDGLSDEIFGDLGSSCTNGLGVCKISGVKVCSADGLGTECNAVPGAPTGNDENCNSVDENCNGIADDNYVPQGTSCGVGACASTGSLICSNGATQDTCVNGTPSSEICDGIIDDDCNGVVDNGCACINGATKNCGPETDAGECVFGTQTCAAGQWGECIGATLPSDETCDGLDNDCDNLIDETFTNKGDSCTVGLGVCKNTGNYVCKADGSDTECSVVPGQPTGNDSNCNLVDENCDGTADENYVPIPTNCGVDLCSNTGTLTCAIGQLVDTCAPKPKVTVYRDADSDTYGNPFVTQDICTLPSGYVYDNTDCDDADGTVNPGAHDICDANNNVIPKDCNSTNNDELNCGSYCGDTDVDGYVPNEIYNNYNLLQQIVCYAKQPGDCNDNNANINPIAVEICDGIDNNCDGNIDEGCAGADKETILTSLTILTSSNNDAQKEIDKAEERLVNSLGNRNPAGDKKIIWLDSAHLFCRHGYHVFDEEKKAVEHLEKARQKDASLTAQVTSLINSIVQADRKLAQTAINEAPASKYKTKALEHFNKGESATDPKKKIQEYRKAWKYINHNCENVEPQSCIEAMEVMSPAGELVSAVGDELDKDTVFTDSLLNKIAFKTDCNKCLKVGMTEKGWTITEIEDDGRLAVVCAAKK